MGIYSLSCFPRVVIPLDSSNWLIRHVLDIVTNLIIRAKRKIEQL